MAFTPPTITSHVSTANTAPMASRVRLTSIPRTVHVLKLSSCRSNWLATATATELGWVSGVVNKQAIPATSAKIHARAGDLIPSRR
jgi:hypothetical protein